MENVVSGESDFWKTIKTLVEQNHIVIDRPKGSDHPKYPDFIYPVDYGYLEGTKAMDGNAIDVFKGRSGGNEITGIFCTVDVLKKDAEIKIVIGCDWEELEALRKIYDGSSCLTGIFIKNPSSA